MNLDPRFLIVGRQYAFQIHHTCDSPNCLLSKAFVAEVRSVGFEGDDSFLIVKFPDGRYTSFEIDHIIKVTN